MRFFMGQCFEISFHFVFFPLGTFYSFEHEMNFHCHLSDVRMRWARLLCDTYTAEAVVSCCFKTESITASPHMGKM